MALDEYLESEVVVAIAATAVTLSPRARRIVRQGMVYGVAGVLMAGDAIAAFARGTARGAREASAPLLPEAAEAPMAAAFGAQGTGDEV